MCGNVYLQKTLGWCNIFKLSCLGAALALFFLTGARLEARPFPDHPVQMIVPYAAGAGVDLVGRAIQPYMEETLGVPLIIGNVPGADSRIGMTRIYKAKADGFTIGLQSLIATVMQEQLFDVPYKALNFSFIYAWTRTPMILFAAENGWKSFDDFQLEARKRPLTLGIAGFGTVVHLLALTMEKHLNVKLKIIAFDGSAQGLTALAGNHIDVNIGSADTAMGLVRAKKVRPILIWSSRPDANFPEIPLSTKYGLPTIVPTRGVFGPPGVPPERIRVLEKAFSRAAAAPKLVEWAKARGVDLISLNAIQCRQEVEKQQIMVSEYKDLLKAH